MALELDILMQLEMEKRDGDGDSPGIGTENEDGDEDVYGDIYLIQELYSAFLNITGWSRSKDEPRRERMAICGRDGVGDGDAAYTRLILRVLWIVLLE